MNARNLYPAGDDKGKTFLEDSQQCSLCYCKERGARHCVRVYELFKNKEQWQDKLDALCPYTQYDKLEGVCTVFVL